ncbi:MAG: hypothetical protein Q4C23_01245 [Mycoplasmatota bacterium]|jgi:hypothetical protein|nr:hypothetical protein [Mycoplasmatota bacterium]
MNKEKLNANDLLKIASSQWATARDIMTIGSVGRNKAYAIRNEIIADYYEGDKRVRNRRLVPMSEVLKYFNINIDYLQEVATYDKQ